MRKCAALCFLLLLVIQRTNAQAVFEAVITNDSKMKISGSTNVHDFSCDMQYIKENKNVVNITEIQKFQVIENVHLKIEVGCFDCGNPQMNKDLQETLKKDEHPYIDMNISMLPIGNIAQYTECPFASEVKITLAGVTNKYHMNFSNICFNSELLSFSGSEQINLLDFNIEPPHALMGLIKVNPTFEIKFEVVARLNGVQSSQ